MALEMIKTCAYKFCSNGFVTRNSRKIYCSAQCKIKEFEEKSKTVLIRIFPVIQCPHCNREIDLKQIKEKK